MMYLTTVYCFLEKTDPQSTSVHHNPHLKTTMLTIPTQKAWGMSSRFNTPCITTE